MGFVPRGQNVTCLKTSGQPSRRLIGDTPNKIINKFSSVHQTHFHMKRFAQTFFDIQAQGNSEMSKGGKFLKKLWC